jgi:hypothetical protein
LKSLPAILIIALSLGLGFGLRKRLVDPQALARTSVIIPPDVLKSPGPDILSIVSLEHRHLWSDMLWLQLVQVLGLPEFNEPGIWNRIYRWADIATDLDPLYITIYRSVSVHLSVFGKKIDDSDAIAEKGWAEMPTQWALPLMIGYNAYFMKGEAARGSKYVYHAARIPGSPTFLPALAGRMRFHSGDESGAIAVLEMMIKSLEGRAKEDAEYRLKAMKSETRLRLFDAACEQFLTDTGTTAKTGEQLVHAGYLNALPFDLFGSSVIFINTDPCLATTEKIKVREAQAHKRAKDYRKQQ